MKSLVKMYLYRLVHSSLFWVCVGLTAISAIITVGIFAEINVQLILSKEAPQHSIAGMLIDSEDFGNWPLILGPAFVSFFFALEWKDGTFRNQILAGKSRTQIFLSAQILGLIISGAVLFIDLFFFFTLGFAFQIPFFIVGTAQTVDEVVSSFWIAFFLLIFLGIFLATIATSFAFIAHNAWGAFGCFIAFLFLSNIIYGVVSLFQGLNYDNYYVVNECLYAYQASALKSLNFDGFSYYGKSGNLVKVVGRTLPLVLKTLFSSLIVGGGMGFLGWLSFTKRDLK